MKILFLKCLKVKFVLVSWYAQAGRELSREEQERIVQVSLQLIDLLQRLDPGIELSRIEQERIVQVSLQLLDLFQNLYSN